MKIPGKELREIGNSGCEVYAERESSSEESMGNTWSSLAKRKYLRYHRHHLKEPAVFCDPYRAFLKGSVSENRSKSDVLFLNVIITLYT